MQEKIKSTLNFSLIIYFFGQFFNLVTPLLVVPYIISVCGVKNFGKTSVALAFAFFVIVIIDFGSDIIGVKDVATNRSNIKKVQNILTINYVSRFMVLIAVLILLTILFFFIPFFNTEKPLFFITLTILIGQYLNPTWFLQGLDQFRFISFLNILSKIIYLIGIFVFIKKPNQYIYINLFWGLGMILSYMFGLFYCYKKEFIYFNKIHFKDILDYLKKGIKFCFSQLFLSFKYYSPIVLISFLGGYSVAGYYKIIEQILSIFRTYLQVVFRFFYPKICFQIDSNFVKGILFWKRVNKLNSLVLLLMLSAIFFNSEIVLTFFKVNPKDLSFLSHLLKFSLIIPLLTSISYAFEQLIFSIDKKDIYIKITFLTVIINFIMMSFLFNFFNIKGLLCSLIITEFFLILCYSIVIFVFFKTRKNGI